jgi:hypothetical protein
MTTEFNDPVPDYADVFSLDEFRDIVASGGIVNDDGCGHWVKDGKMSRDFINCAKLGPYYVPEGVTHVAWFNK